MAIAIVNPILSHLHGVQSDVKGREVVSRKADQTEKESIVQKRNHDQFREASLWAKKQLLDPQKESFYAASAEKLKLPSAYIAAISDFIGTTVISDVNVNHYNGKAGDEITMKIFKKDFDVHHAEITLYDKEGVEIESGIAVKRDRHYFSYCATETLHERTSVRLCIIAGAPGTRRTMKEVMLGDY